MSDKVKLSIIDEAGAKKTEIQVPTNWSVGKLVDAFVKKMGLPTIGNDGQPISYRAISKKDSAQLDSAKTIGDSALGDGDALRLVSAIVEGSLDPRTRRLRKDYEKLVDLELRCQGMLGIKLLDEANLTHYLLTFDKVPGLFNEEGTLEKRESHEVELYLPRDYPLGKPVLTFKTPIFHPNIYPNRVVCLGTRWTPMISITDVVVDVANMIQFKSYNTQSPADATANDWIQDYEEKMTSIIQPVDFPPTERLLASGGAGPTPASMEDDLVILE